MSSVTFRNPIMLLPFPFEMGLKVYLKNKSVTVAEVRRLAEAIAGRYLDETDANILLQNYLDLGVTINQIKVNTLGLTGPVRMTNELMLAIGAAGVALFKGDIKELCNLSFGLSEHMKARTDDLAWFFPKLYSMYVLALWRKNMEEFAQNPIWSAEADQILENLSVSIPDLDDQNRQMAAEIQLLRQYGVKSVYFQDGILHKPDEAWIFVDPNLIADLTPGPRKEVQRQMMASITLGEKATITNLTPVKETIPLEGKARIFVAQERINLGVASVFVVEMDQVGELDLSSGLGVMPARRIFERLGQQAAYEVFRMSLLYRLYDLVIPTVRARALPELPTVKDNEGPGASENNATARRRLLTAELIIPRLQLMSNRSLLTDELQTEIAEGALGNKPMRNHDVINHTRLLLPGQHASKEALERAIEDGFGPVPEGRTYVKKHDRGSGPSMPPHRARQRR